MTKELTGRHVALILFSFFGVMFAVNGAFVYFALGSFSGISVEEAYKRGLSYNQELASHESQEARNWTAMLDFKQTGENTGEISLGLSSVSGATITDVTVEAELRRPVIDLADNSYTLALDGDKFASDLQFIEKGQWDIVILVHGGGYDSPYKLEKRIWVK